MSFLEYYSAEGFGQVTRKKYGFSDACIVGDRIEVTGQVGINPATLQVPAELVEEINQAFNNLEQVINIALSHSSSGTNCNGGSSMSVWDYVVKITSYHVNLSQDRSRVRDIMVRLLKERFTVHQPLFTMLGVESLPLEDTNVEIEALVYIRQ
ncbi:hypothetical protein OPT61_g2832 [Boeremia exigua]|uniref:Uncharacterized protein n=1 Tax=Boeremia exigua TaxID=749465 RepID=A0ACC2IK84_9PLEO|nr:hypothetical protein OPT61_g2832 [Boeremia exigua]